MNDKAERHVNASSCPLCEDMLSHAHSHLVAWFLDCAREAAPNAHISCSYRGPEAQNLAFQSGMSKLQYPNSRHNRMPAEALDLFALSTENIASFPYKFYLKIWDATLRRNYVSIEWGGNWKSFKDYPHFQLQALKGV